MYLEGDKRICLNIGCEDNLKFSTLKEYWINVDYAQISNIPEGVIFYQDNIMELASIKTDTCDLVEAFMVFEHLHPDTIPHALWQCNRVLKEDGTLKITVPNFDKLVDKYIELRSKSKWSAEDWFDMKQIMFYITNSSMGKRRDNHQSLWSTKIATLLLNAEGFEIAGFTSNGTKDYHLNIIAKKTGTY